MAGDLLTLLLLVTATATAAPCPRGTLTDQVTYVRDGDTIVVGSMPIRLNGLAAPEWDEPGGAAATKAMIELVDGLTLRCELNGEHTGDRCVGICYLEGVDIAAEMVAAGLARELSEVQRRPIPRGGAEDRSSRRDDRADLPAAGVLP